MSKAEIIAELARLSREDLAEVRAQLDRISQDNVPAQPRGASHVRSPRLANPALVVDFQKQVTELPTDAEI